MECLCTVSFTSGTLDRYSILNPRTCGTQKNNALDSIHGNNTNLKIGLDSIINNKVEKNTLFDLIYGNNNN